MGHYDDLREAEATESVPTEAVQVDSLLKERGDRYGSFVDNANLTQALHQTIMQYYFKSHPETPLPPTSVEALHNICAKLSRIANGDPTYRDNWDDIAGYAQLAAEAL
jgi:hypothetical protein